MALRGMGEGRENSVFWVVEDSEDLCAILALASKKMHEMWIGKVCKWWRKNVCLDGEFILAICGVESLNWNMVEFIWLRNLVFIVCFCNI